MALSSYLGIALMCKEGASQMMDDMELASFIHSGNTARLIAALTSCVAGWPHRMSDTALARSSDDFWPRDPASHTTHVAVNALNSLFMAPLVQPDWDMFHSVHPAALMHARARVVRALPLASMPARALASTCALVTGWLCGRIHARFVSKRRQTPPGRT